MFLCLLSGPGRFPATLCRQCLAVLLSGMWRLCCEMGGKEAESGCLYQLLVKLYRACQGETQPEDGMMEEVQLAQVRWREVN